MRGSRQFYRMFGVVVASSLRLPGVPSVPAPVSGEPTVTVDLADAADLEARFSGATIHRGRLSQGDGEHIDVVLGVRSDILLRYGERAAFLIEPGAGAVLCAPAAPRACEWLRVL